MFLNMYQCHLLSLIFLLPALQTLRGRQQAEPAGHRITKAMDNNMPVTIILFSAYFLLFDVFCDCVADAERHAAS